MRSTVITVALLLALAVGASHLAPADGAPASVGTYPPGWNLISGPEGARVTGASGALYTLQSGDSTYETLPIDGTLQACAGYWAYFPSGGSVDGGTDSGSCVVPLVLGGWVMAGNPATSGPATITGADVTYTYDPANGYSLVSSLPPGQGAWVTGSGRASLAVPSFRAPAVSAPVAPPTAAPPVAATQAPAPAPSTGGCCRTCTTGKACGNSCINRNLTCHQPAGCACNATVIMSAPVRLVLVLRPDRVPEFTTNPAEIAQVLPDPAQAPDCPLAGHVGGLFMSHVVDTFDNVTLTLRLLVAVGEDVQ